MNRRKSFIVAALLGMFLCSGAHAQWIVHDPVSFVGIIENVYNGYERILGMYNQIKTQAEQYQKQLQAMQSFKDRFKDSMNDSWSSLKAAFKDLNSFENLTDIQKVEASRQSLRNLVKTEQSYEQELYDVTLGALKRGVTSPSGKEYTVADVFGIDESGHFDPKRIGGSVLNDVGEYFEKEKKDMLDTWEGNLTNEERGKLFSEYGASRGQVLYWELTKEKRQINMAERGASVDKVARMEEKMKNSMMIDALGAALEKGEDANSELATQQAHAMASLQNLKIGTAQYEATQQVIEALNDIIQKGETDEAQLRAKLEQEQREVEQRQDERKKVLWVKGRF